MAIKENDVTRNTNIDVYSDLGVRPIIDCQSQRTALGGSRLSAEVTAAMEGANSSCVDDERPIFPDPDLSPFC